jgi:serine/threonine protein kinase
VILLRQTGGYCVLEALSRLGPYEIVARLGAGGMGEVYRARDTRLGREVAVKILLEPYINDPVLLARFEREARAVAALSHPNILSIHDYGTDGAITYAVTELLEGATLRVRLAKGPLPWREAVEVGAAIADGLAAAHAQGIVHRDLKPENLFVTSDGRVKILDFGLARVQPPPNTQDETDPYVPAQTNPGTVMGTVGYMSPEQVRGQAAEAASDLFSVGCVLYEMLAARRAFQRETAAETMTAILHDEPPSWWDSGDQVPPELDRLVRQCLAKSPSKRLHSARDLALALRATAANPSPQSPATHRSVEAVAVLPFENVSRDAKTEYLSDGVADQIINSLSQVRRAGLKVRPFSSVARYKGQQPDVPSIARALKVQVVVTGTLQQQGDDLSIRVALVDVQEDSHLWGQWYQGKLSGILDLQDQIARDVATNLRLRLTGEEDQRLTKRYTQDTEAYLLFREATYHFNKFTEAGLETSIDYCRRALKKDPNYALAYMGLGRCYQVLGAIHRGWRETHADARNYHHRSLRIDGTLAEPHVGLAVLHLMHDWDWSAAERELKQAVALDPDVGVIWEIDCFRFAALGRLPDALTRIQRGLELDPLSVRTIGVFAIPTCHSHTLSLASRMSQKECTKQPRPRCTRRSRAVTCTRASRECSATPTRQRGIGRRH